ncbi:chitin elicitor receptor kinase 1 [Magnolia sinica]|uniref:chitin elicitor receptor kinase 1 n=1 Tax=Magnolia sinica TaxID=86752 RepID=UPI00265958D5|nr:chitin elicitor receptor kinase 1 [Magnolia sinica]
MIRNLELGFLLSSFFLLWIGTAEAKCSRGCETALASYYVTENNTLTSISQLFGGVNINSILSYNLSQIPNKDSIQTDTRVNVPFSCECLKGDFLGYIFKYQVQPGDTYIKIATEKYKNLTTIELLRMSNSIDENNIQLNSSVDVPVNCSCGDRRISRDYGFFLTYPLRPEDNLSSIVNTLGTPPPDVVQRYNDGLNFSSGAGLAFIPVRDPSGSYRPLKSSTGISGGAVAGISVAAVAIILFLGVCLYIGASRRKKLKKASLLRPPFEDNSIHHGQGPVTALDRTTESVALVGASSPGLTGITVDKSVEFSYEELAKATSDFSLANKIGEGGFGAVYYAELRGEKAAIKKMDMQATREFLAELKVLTHVHHLNLVRLIGYCVETSLFLVYEFIENGNLSQHLRGSGREPLPWSSRVQIALDSARGLEYIHEHTVPVYIHRDIKSANILIDKNFHGKVADFGLTKLTEVGSTSLPTRLVGTFGYMPPEYAQYGDVSPKVDVYAFGVVLYELISAKEAVVKTGGSIAESKGLVALFEDALSEPDPREDLRKLVDPRLGDSYPLDSVHKMAQLAKACTQENPQLRPSMRSIVVALMTLSSSTEDWDVGSFYENQALVNLMSGR